MAEDSLNAIDTAIQIGAIGVVAGTAAVHGASQLVTGKTKQSKPSQSKPSQSNRNPNLSSTKVYPISNGSTELAQKRGFKKRLKSFRNRQVTAATKQCPILAWVLSLCYPSLILLLFYLDIFADINMAYNLSKLPSIQWAFYIMATFISLQVASALLGINLYARHELKDQYGLRFVVLCTSPILVLICDSLMIFYRPMERYLPDRLVIFMVQYEALRKISEFALETIPQSVLQIVLFFLCASTVECGFEAAEEVGMYMHDSGKPVL